MLEKSGKLQLLAKKYILHSIRSETKLKTFSFTLTLTFTLLLDFLSFLLKHLLLFLLLSVGLGVEKVVAAHLESTSNRTTTLTFKFEIFFPSEERRGKNQRESEPTHIT